MSFLIGDYAFNLVNLPIILGSSLIFIVGLLIWLRERSSPAGLSFQILLTTQQIYSIGLIGNLLATDPITALRWQRISGAGLALFACGVYQYALIITKNTKSYSRSSNLLWGVSSIFALIAIATDLLFLAPHHYWFGYFVHWTPGGLAAISFVLAFGIGGAALRIREMAYDQTTSPEQRRRAMLHLKAGICGSVAVVDFLPVLGYEIYPFGALSMLATVLVLGYITLRYRLVDITPSFASQRILTTMHDPLLVLDENGIIRIANPAAEKLLGLSEHQLLHHPLPAVLSNALPEDIRQKTLNGEDVEGVEIVCTPQGSLPQHLMLSIATMRSDVGEIDANILILKNISAQRAAENETQMLVNYDPLTQLPNRFQNRKVLDQALADAKGASKQVAILLMDLDQFKQVNDSYGHTIGDALLKEASLRLRRSLLLHRPAQPHHYREIDGMLSRLGGDEFSLILFNTNTPEMVKELADRILKSFSLPITVSGHDIFLGISIGIARYPEDAEDAEGLLRKADIAMYHAKATGRNNYQRYEPWMDAAVEKRIRVENGLRKALERDELVLHYQPQVDIQTGKILGAEALVRWQHPELGLLPPAEFITIAEESGLIIPLGHWVLKTACRQWRQWKDAGYQPIRIAVNLSARQFQPDLLDIVRSAVEENQIDPNHLELEITESVLMQDKDITARTLQSLRDLGLFLTIDDFGTGYSSLSYLKKFPITGVKIDHSFIREVPHNPDDTSLTTAILAMATSLKLEVVPEGIENEAQLHFLQARHHGMAQGYLFGRPMPADQLEALLDRVTAVSTQNFTQIVP